MLENALWSPKPKIPANRVPTTLRASTVMYPDLLLLGLSVHASNVAVGWFAVICVVTAS